MANSERKLTRVGMVPNLQPIVLGEGGLTVQQLSAITSAIDRLVDAVNGRITFGDGVHSTQSGNIDGHTKTVYFAEANVDVEVPHGLGRRPIGIVLLAVDKDSEEFVDKAGNPGYYFMAGVRASAEGSWTDKRLFVRCDTAGTTARFIVV